MKKLLVIVIVFTALSASAQKLENFKFNIGGELGLTTGNLNSYYTVAIGGSAQANYMIAHDAAITGNIGIIDLLGKKITGTNLRYQSAALIPLLAGVEYYFVSNVFASAQLGVSFSTARDGGSSFTYAPGIGYKFDKQWTGLLKYTGYSNNGNNNGGTVGVRVAYTF